MTNMTADLVSTDGLRKASDIAVAAFQQKPRYPIWLAELRKFLTEIHAVGQEEFVSEVFQRRLWEVEVISATGMGSVNVSQVVSSKDIAEHLWAYKSCVLPAPPMERVQASIDAWDKCLALVGPLVKRTPWLKMCRVFAALQPTEFTTVAHWSKLRRLARAMGIPNARSEHFVALHRRVLDRLSEVLGPAKPAPDAEGVVRMALPWLLFAMNFQEQGDEATTVMEVVAGAEKLNPLPAERRRRGLLAIKGFLPSIRSMIEFAKDGCNREDLREHIHSINSYLAPNSIATNINALIAEWGVLRASGDQLSLTPRGEALLETGDPAEVSDWLLTRILGFDNLLFMLKEQPASVSELVPLLQKVNPGWTSSFAPTTLINWIRSLGLVESDPQKRLRLTDDGKNWASRIHWIPASLPPQPKAVTSAADSVGGISTDLHVQRSPLKNVIAAFPAAAVFDPSLIARLDAGLWHNERRHFAVLTGLSGAGKTLLARNYALALWVGAESPEDGLYTLPVQPGWYDPSSILGYVNPLVGGTYVKTGFIEFLLRAGADPTRPYTVVLDEMNLSHPEQYLAPLLSAMETGEDIELHTFDDDISGVPPRIPYPNNLVLIGTVNMDETTHGLSDKVLDRAFVIEFWDVDVKAYPGWGNNGLDSSVTSKIRDLLIELGAALRPVRLHFGWRTIGDVVGYVRAASAGGILDINAALDHAIYSKILPKLRGEDTPRLRGAFSSGTKILEAAGLMESAAKLKELADDLQRMGSARFWR